MSIGTDRKIEKVYAGYAHSMVITDTSEVYVWGDGKNGQLARVVKESNEPLPVDELGGKNIKKG